MKLKPLFIERPTARTTAARSVLCAVGVLFVVLVATLAMSFGSFTVAANESAYSASNVDQMRHGFQVLRVYAATEAAQMVYVEAFWERPNEQFVGGSVGECDSAESKGGVTSFVAFSKPEPATGIRLGRDLLEETFYAGFGHVILLRSHRSGLRSASIRFAAPFYFNAETLFRGQIATQLKA